MVRTEAWDIEKLGMGSGNGTRDLHAMYLGFFVSV